MSDPTPTPSPEPTWTLGFWWNEAKSILMGMAIGMVIVGHTPPAPHPAPIPAPAPAPAPQPPGPPAPAPAPTPVKHAGTFYLSYIEAVDTTPQASAIRDAAVGTDWKSLNCRWRSYTDGQAVLAETGVKAWAPTLPAVVIQELPSGTNPDSAKLPSSPVIDVITSPASLDAIMARVKVLRGE